MDGVCDVRGKYQTGDDCDWREPVIHGNLPTWIINSLTPEQLSPFYRDTQNASILAAAGSGKTRALVRMVAADLVAGTPPDSIIAFTFTEKAANEMLARIHALSSEHMHNIDLSGIYIGTIHAWCLQYLLDQSNFYNFSSVDELHLDALVSRLYDTLNLTKIYGRSYPKAIPYFLADLEIFYNENLSIDRLPEHIRLSIYTFIKILNDNRLITFGGMIRAATEYLNSSSPIAKLKAIYIDEYQDVNPAQVALIKAMTPTDCKVHAVGDDLQCIYQWRGSDVNRILSFSKEFSNTSIHRLSTNYRSRPSIVHTANNIAKYIKLRDTQKIMLSVREDTHFETVQWLSFSSEEQQVNAVIEIVRRFLELGVPANRIAILLRSVTGSGQPFVNALKAANIPVVCPILSRGGLFINEVVIPIMDWLRNEHPTPKNEIDEANAEANANDLWQSLQTWVKASNSETTFWTALYKWYDAIDVQKSSAYDIRGFFYNFLDTCELRIGPDDTDLMVGIGIASQIIRSVEEIHRRRLAGQSRRTPRGVVSEIYYALVRRHQDFGESVPIQEIGNGVIVSTIHQAKGLEWPIVIIPMLIQRRFPIKPSSHGTSFPDEVAARYGTNLDDERRLFYVATTRAKERLFLLDPKAQSPKSRSVFLHDLVEQGFVKSPSLDCLPNTFWNIAENDLITNSPSPVRIGLSDLLLYIECPFQYGLRRVVGIEPSIGDELGYGQSMHELIQRRLEDGKPWSDSYLNAQAQKHVFMPYMSESGQAQAQKAIENRVHVLEKLGVFNLVVESEITVEVVFDVGIVTGIIDLVIISQDGSVCVRDWKSSLHDSFFSRYERQIRFYAYALRQQGRVVNGADIVDIAASAEVHSIVAHNIDISQNTTDQTITEVKNALTQLAANKYPANPSDQACSICDMRLLCAKKYQIKGI